MAPLPGVSFAVAAGDDGASSDIAQSFLSGCTRACYVDPDSDECVVRPALHVPSTADARFLHRDLTIESYLRYFVEGELGDDDPEQGIDRADVMVYVGHGTPTEIETHGFATPASEPRSMPVRIEDLLVGDDGARYLLLLSCNVMAHGPARCGRGTVPYGCPQRFSGAAGDRNVFATWKDHMAPELRMVCGGSSELDATRAPAAFWHARYVYGLPVADAFLVAASGRQSIPLCLAHGPEDPRQTPLATDADFRTAPGSDGGYLHAMYPVRDARAAREVAADLEELIAKAHRPGARATPPPLWKPPLIEVKRTTVSPGSSRRSAVAITTSLGIEAFTLRVDRVRSSSVDGASVAAGRRCFETCSYARAPGWVEVDGYEVPLLDEAGEWLLRSCPAGSGVSGRAAEPCPAAGSGSNTLSFVELTARATIVPRLPALLGKAADDAAWDLLGRQQVAAEPRRRYQLVRRGLGYVTAPVPCQRRLMVPVQRYVFRRRSVTGTRGGDSIEVKVPVYQRGDLAAAVRMACGS